MIRWLTHGIVLLTCVLLTACTAATQAHVSEEFDKSVKTYNRMLRWQEIENAGMTYIEPELRDQYLKQAELLKKRGFTVADYRIVTSTCLPEKKTGDVVAEFDYYLMPSNKIKTVSYRQEWTYRESLNSWILKTGLPVFE
jgi:predicted component of type VI protein secretion system